MRDNFALSMTNIQNIYDSQKELIKQLRDQIEELKSKNYKDKELSRLKNQLQNTIIESRHYGLKAKDYNNLINWWNKHKKKHNNESDSFIKMKKYSDGYRIEIDELAECTCYTLKCLKCNEYHSVFY